jgi:hypothetical protein
MKIIFALIAAALGSCAASAQSLWREYHTNLMMADIAASEVVAVVTINSVGDKDSTNAAGQKTRFFTFDGKPERTLKGTLPSEVRITFETTNIFSQLYVPDLPASYVCFLKQDRKNYASAISGAGLHPSKRGYFDWRSKFPSVEQLEGIVKKSLTQR